MSMLFRRSLGAEASNLAEQLGFTLGDAGGTTMTGSHQDRTFTLTIQWADDRQARYGRYQVTYQLALNIPNTITFVVEERNRLLRPFRHQVPIDQQTGRTMVTERYMMSTEPNGQLTDWLNSLDFCYSLLLLPVPVLTIKAQQLSCQQVTTVAHHFEVTNTLKQLCLFAQACEEAITLPAS